MSDFHEYVTEIIFVRDEWRLGWSGQTSDVVRVRDSTKLTIGVKTSDSIRVADQSRGQVTAKIVDKVRVRDIPSVIYQTTAAITEKVRVREELRLGVGVRTVDVVHAVDSTRPGWSGMIEERIRVRDANSQVGILTYQPTDRIRVRDRVKAFATAKSSDLVRVTDKSRANPVTVWVTESVRVRDTSKGSMVARSADSVRSRDTARGNLTGARSVDRVRVRGRSFGDVLHKVSDTIRVKDSGSGRVSALARTSDVIRVRDFVGGTASAIGRVSDVIRVRDSAWGQHHAVGRTSDIVYVADVLPAAHDRGFAWTAPVDGWSMSRYDGFPFTSLVVIDGMAYGSSHDGVYALKGGDAPIVASITTAKIDVGKGTLAHPISSYLEYSLAGSACMTVTQTQSGLEAQSWTYQLEDEPALNLTNGRFQFGRGLRGRHFSFDLRFVGTHAHINDLYVVADATKRRV